MPDAAATHRAYGSLADGVHAAARARFSQDHRWVNLPFGEDKPLSVGRCVLSDRTVAHRARGSSSMRARASESGGGAPGREKAPECHARKACPVAHSWGAASADGTVVRGTTGTCRECIIMVQRKRRPSSVRVRQQSFLGGKRRFTRAGNPLSKSHEA